MNIKPLEDIQADNTTNETTVPCPTDDDCYGYNDNLTAKLGGNYAKVIEFYDHHL